MTLVTQPVVVTEDALRQFLRKSLSRRSILEADDKTPAVVNDTVDPSAQLTDPAKKNTPTNKTELRAALTRVIDDLQDHEIKKFYDDLKSSKESSEDKGEEKMSINKNESRVEETIRRAVRKMLSEMGPYRDTGLSYSGPMIGSAGVKEGYEECEACGGEGILDDGTDCSVCKGKGGVPSKKRKNKMMSDVGGASFKEIAQEMGYASESGAKQAVEKALQKAQFVAQMDPDDLQILTLTAMNDYIELLKSSDELTAEDVDLMKANPNIIQTLDGFREYLDKHIRRAMKKAGKEDK